jgi:hypothetical protein
MQVGRCLADYASQFSRRSRCLRLLRCAGRVEQLVQALLHTRDLRQQDLNRLRDELLRLVLPC